VVKALVAISSCVKNSQRRDWQRETWIQQLPFNYRFFVGGDGCAELDTIVLSCRDDYKSLPSKTLELIRWALANEYEYILKLDDDVYVRPERLHVPTDDYVGHAYGHKHYCSGAAYWLSATAMSAILRTRKFFIHTAEDYCVGHALERAGITLTEDHRYRVGWKTFDKDVGENEFPHPDNDTITFHMYFPEFMVELHNNWTQKQLVDAFHFNSLRNRY
jgi:Galactosyltransferase